MSSLDSGELMSVPRQTSALLIAVPAGCGEGGGASPSTAPATAPEGTSEQVVEAIVEIRGFAIS
jgi:hypothetical protein